MKNIAGKLGIVAGAAAVLAILYYRREDVSRLTSSAAGSAKKLGNKMKDYATEMKDRLLHNVNGPNGEAVYLDMYDRQFYEDTEGKRVYLEEV